MELQTAKLARFRNLHESSKAFVIPNPWDAGSARLLASLGFEALATTSAGYAFAHGKTDSLENLSRDGVLANAGEIVTATDLPVSADLQNGFGDTPETCAETIRLAHEVGLVGGSIEDTTGDGANPVYEFEHAVDRIRAAAEMADRLGFVLTARAESFLFDRPDLDQTIGRLKAFEDAGAQVLYAPGLPDIEAIKAVCEALEKPVNVVMGLKGPVYSIEELAAAGVKRISVGGSMARAALGALMRAAEEIKSTGTFSYAAEALPGAQIAHIMKGD